MVTLVSACGQQVSPSLQLETVAPEASNGAAGRSSEALEPSRSSSELEIGAQRALEPRKRLNVFQSKIEPLALQRGGSARIVLPVSEDPGVVDQIQSISFSSTSSALRATTIQGRVLAVVVDSEAAEGRHEARILVQLGNGTIFSQPLAISVLP